jgi:hypothetical protein
LHAKTAGQTRPGRRRRSVKRPIERHVVVEAR